MDNLPPLAICMVTYKRTDLALRTIRGVSEFLGYPKELLGWYIADDGSDPDHPNALLEQLNTCSERVIGVHNIRYRPAGKENSYFCGKGWNNALTYAHRFSDFVLWAEDDWELRKPLDIRPYIQMLSERQDVGIVRLGHLAVGSDVRIVGHAGVHYLEYLRTTQYAYSGNPLIRHRRFLDYYGFYSEEKNPGEIETDYDSRFREGVSGPSIWRPADIPGWGVFGHIGTDKSFV